MAMCGGSKDVLQMPQQSSPEPNSLKMYNSGTKVEEIKALLSAS